MRRLSLFDEDSEEEDLDDDEADKACLERRQLSPVQHRAKLEDGQHVREPGSSGDDTETRRSHHKTVADQQKRQGYQGTDTIYIDQSDEESGSSTGSAFAAGDYDDFASGARAHDSNDDDNDDDHDDDDDDDSGGGGMQNGGESVNSEEDDERAVERGDSDDELRSRHFDCDQDVSEDGKNARSDDNRRYSSEYVRGHNDDRTGGGVSDDYADRDAAVDIATPSTTARKRAPRRAKSEVLASLSQEDRANINIQAMERWWWARVAASA